MTELEAAWVAGIIEGEGCFYQMNKYSVRFAVEMSDMDVVQRVKRLLGITTKTHIRDRAARYGTNHKMTFTIYTGNREKVKEIVAAVWPWLGERRKMKCRELGVAPE